MAILKGLEDYFRLNHHLYHYSEEKIREYQLRALINLVALAKKKSVFYSKLYRNSEVKTISDFLSLPTINKQIMMDNYDELNTCGLKINDLMEFAIKKELTKDYLGYYQDKYVVGLSSGTSGNKGIYVTDRALTERLPFVFLARGGIPLKLLPFRILFLLRVFSQGFADINSPLVRLKYLSTMTEIEKIIATINNEQINILMAPPSMLRILVSFSNRIERDLKMIVTYAEVLYDEDKILFEKAFNTKVIQIYQASEGQIGSSCKFGNLHINEDLVFVELYDREGKIINKPHSIAEKMIVTNLINEAQPLIGYEMNDLIVLGEKCKCGSNFRTIKKILGRHDDVLYLNNTLGEKQHIFPDLFSRWIITSHQGIREFQVIQQGNTIELYVDVFEGANHKEISEELFNRIRNELASYSIKNVDIKIIIQKLELPQNMSKYKRFIMK